MNWSAKPIAGHYVWGQWTLPFHEKPVLFHRVMMRWFFGFVWEDAKRP